MADRQSELASLVEQAVRATPQARQVEGGTEWEFFCPAHEGSQDPHAYWNRRKGTWNCRKCGATGSTYDLATRLGVELPADRARATRDLRILKEYDYRDETGELIFQVVRLHPKDFRVRRPSGDPHRPWIWDRKGVTPVLYRLPVIAAAKPDDWVLLVEGEKDADRAVAEGWLLATTNPFGAQAPGKNGPGKPKWEPQYTASLRGRNVVVCLDDDPAGGNSQRQIANILRGHVKALKLLKLPRMNPPQKKDLSDWFDDDGSIEELRRLVESAPEETVAVVTSEEDHDPDDISRFAMTDAGNGELFAHLYGSQVRYDHQRGRWLVWKGHWWGADPDGQRQRWAVEMARIWGKAASDMPTEKQVAAALRHARSSESQSKIEATLKMASIQHPIADPGTGWDSAPTLLGVANGVVNLATGELRAGRQDDLITLSTPVPFDPSAKCPRWVQFISEIFEGDREMIDYIQRAVGYSLSGSTAEQVWFICYGKGANGKSTFLEVLAKAFGMYAGNMPFTALMKGREQAIPTDLAALPGKRLITASETQEHSVLNEARIKALTGGDTITARQLYERQFQYQPELKLWVALNHLPEVTDSSEGFWRRVRVIGFTRHFSGAERDTGLKEKLIDELPGILNWAIQGARMYLSDGLPVPEKVTIATQNYQQSADTFELFITERCVRHPAAQVRAGLLYAEYDKWATEQGIRLSERMTGVSFGKRMLELYTKVRHSDGFYYKGVGLLAAGEAAVAPVATDRAGLRAGLSVSNELECIDAGFGEKVSQENFGNFYGENSQNHAHYTSIHSLPCLCPGRHENDDNPCSSGYWWEEAETGELHCSVCHPEMTDGD